MTVAPDEHQTVIVGGGISGLMAAKAALERGEKNITVYEASDRFGGKLISGKIGGDTINMGAEFIDEENVKIRALAKEVGVNLIPTGDQSKELFQSPSGKLMPDFLKDFAPIHQAMETIRNEMERNPEFAARMKDMSAEALMGELQAKTPVAEKPGILGMIGNFLYNAAMFVTFQTSRANRVSKEVTDTALAAAEKELGAKASDITAAQFLSEFSPSSDRFLASTCDYRAEGGTAAITDALKKQLEEKGVKFEAGHKLTSLGKEGDDKVMNFSTEGGEKTIRSKKVVMALPSYGLSEVKGLEFLGLADNPVQYTKNAKITVKLKPGIMPPGGNANIFLTGSECWVPKDGFLTFLVENTKGEPRAIVMKKALENYAQTFGMKAEDLFYIEGGKPLAGSFAYTNPGDAPCWSTPSPKNARQMEQLFAKMETLADQGLGFVGTYLPLPDGGVGFMECGAHSVERVANRMFGPARGAGQEVAMSHQVELPQHSFAAAATRARTEQQAGRGLAS